MDSITAGHSVSSQAFVGLYAGNTNIEIKSGSPSARPEGYQYKLGGGLEMVVSPQMSVRPSLWYQDIDGWNYLELQADVNIWLSDSVFIALNTGYAFKDRDVIYCIGVGGAF